MFKCHVTKPSGQCLNATWHNIGGQCLDGTWLNLGGHYSNATGICLVKMVFDQSKNHLIIVLSSQKY